MDTLRKNQSKCINYMIAILLLSHSYVPFPIHVPCPVKYNILNINTLPCPGVFLLLLQIVMKKCSSSDLLSNNLPFRGKKTSTQCD